jgi:uncharacterized protein YjbI with pentapeptide repeats
MVSNVAAANPANIASRTTERKEHRMPNQISLKHDDISSSQFEDLNMSRSDFRGVNLSGSQFHDINFSDVSFAAAQLGGTTFKHIGPPDGNGEPQRPVLFEEGILRASIFRKVDMSNVKLIDCNIEGMTIDGVLISDLLDAHKRQKDQ